MKAKQKDFTPIMVSFDDIGFANEEKRAKEKLELLDKASFWIHNAIPIKKLKLKSVDNNMLDYFYDLVLAVFKEENTLGLSAEKLIELKEIPFKELHAIATEYYKNDFEVTFPDGVPKAIVKRKPFERWTTNNNQNKLLLAGNKFINACEDLSKIQNVAQFTIAQATNGFIRFDMHKNKYYVNPEVIYNG